MQIPLHRGSTSDIFELEAGILLKVPRRVLADNKHYALLNKERAEGLKIEAQVYGILGEHNYILPHYGIRKLEGHQGLALARADRSLQQVLDSLQGSEQLDIRRLWCVQAAEAVAHMHDRGVLHCDLRPDNFLVRKGVLQLSDFNGAFCHEHGLDGQQLPDGGFWNLQFEATAHTDIFGLGSVIYSILTGHWPFCAPGQLVRTDRNYEEEANERFRQGIYPEVTNLEAANVIRGCWDGHYHSARDIAEALQKAFKSSEG